MCEFAREDTMASQHIDIDDFAVVSSWKDGQIYASYKKLHDAHVPDVDTSLQAALRSQWPELCLTSCYASNGDYLNLSAHNL